MRCIRAQVLRDAHTLEDILHGSQIVTTEYEDMLIALSNNNVPAQWRNQTFPTGRKSDLVCDIYVTGCQELVYSSVALFCR